MTQKRLRATLGLLVFGASVVWAAATPRSTWPHSPHPITAVVSQSDDTLPTSAGLRGFDGGRPLDLGLLDQRAEELLDS